MSGARYRHKARGTEYSVIAEGAELQDATNLGVKEGALLTIYRGDDGKVWARRASEFGDGRFERIASVPDRVADLEAALGLALAWLAPNEPGDSRAVSDEFVAMAAIQAGLTGRIDECRGCIAEAAARLTREQPDA